MKAEWMIVKLGEVASFDKAKHDGERLTYVGLEDIESDTSQFIGSYEPKGVKGGSFKFTEEHVLYGRLRPYLNKAIAPNFGGHCSTEIFPIMPASSLNKGFLLRWLIWHKTRDKIDATSTGARMPRANMNEVMGFEVPLPPLEEQQAIVDKLDRAFAGLETARANAEANLENAKELFQAALTKSLDNKTSQVPLADLADANYGYTASAAHNIDGVKFLRITDIQNGTVTWQQVPSCSISPEDKEKYRLIPDDIVFARTGATTGKSYLITDEIDAVAASYLIRLRVKDDRVRPRFLYAFFQSSAYWREVRKGIEGAAQGGFNASKLGKLLIPLVSLEEQELISAMLSRLQDETDRLQEEYIRQLSDLDELKQSLLQKAFAGELT